MRKQAVLNSYEQSILYKDSQLLPLFSHTHLHPYLPPDENPKKAENREIALYLILIAEVVILASAVLL